jgi:hypothetical protein
MVSDNQARNSRNWPGREDGKELARQGGWQGTGHKELKELARHVLTSSFPD